MDTELNKTTNLTGSQLLLWTGQELNPNIPLYNMALTFELRGAIQGERFQDAFQELVKQSDAMRTTFKVENGVPVQQVGSDLNYTLELLDWSDDVNSEKQLINWVKNQSQQMFDLKVCAFYSALIKLSKDRYVWYLNQHHLITDAWAVSVQYHTLVKLYQARLENRRENAPKLPLFRQYINFEHISQHDPANQDSVTFWSEKSRLLPPAPKLYGQNPTVSETASSRVSIDLGMVRSSKLRALTTQNELRAWTQHLALYNIFTTVLFAYLYRITGERHLSIGTPAHNRPTTDFKNTPGVFIELFPLVTDIGTQDTFLELFQKLRLEINSFLRHARPGATNSKLNRSFHVILNYIHAEFADFGNIPMSSKWIHPGHCDPRHYLRLQVHDFDASGSIQLHFDLNKEIFDLELQKNAPQHFLSLLDAFIQDRQQKIEMTPILTESEFQGLINNFNYKRPIQFSPSVLDLFTPVAVDHHQSIAAFQKGRSSVSYKELDQKSNQLAHFLIDSGIGKGEVVALYMTRSIELIIGIWGVIKSGAAYVPIASNNPFDRVAAILKDVNAALIITNEGVNSMANQSLLQLDADWQRIDNFPDTLPDLEIDPAQAVYIIYTSGSTGKPKGVVISHGALANYLTWARSAYAAKNQLSFPLFTLVSFDLTVTSIFLPLITGGQVVIYPEGSHGPDLSILQVVEEDLVNAIKLTPSHLALLSGKNLSSSKIQLLIAGGEILKSTTAGEANSIFGKDLKLFNEYGPTEATVGCIVHKFSSEDLQQPSIPIGEPITNMQAYVLDNGNNPVPKGVIGRLFLSGSGLFDGYLNQPDYTSGKLVANPFIQGDKMYDTGDLARMDHKNRLIYLGRTDQQVQIGGIRVELGEIEAVLNQFDGVSDSVADLQIRQAPIAQKEIQHCVSCGLPSNYPSIGFDRHGVCDLCLSFKNYHQKARKYFRDLEDLKSIFESASSQKSGRYDCIMLLSGGKDSTYALARLVDMGLNVLAFTLDNGFISDEAKANIKRVVGRLGVDHMFGETKSMNAIFVDSLRQHANVCNGCFKTIYTLSTKLAIERQIPIIVTGLSRGQFFETRLTEELFRKPDVDFDRIDKTILEARKAYHRADDAINRLLDASFFKDDLVFEQVQFIDFYRYCDVSLSELLSYLDQKLPWIRPSDTGRSTNCLINQAGIYVHKKLRGYSNYAFPYSWDVRMGHKTRDASLEEINEVIEEQEALRMLDEIGFTLEGTSPERQQLVAYYVGDTGLSETELKEHLAKALPDYMVPSQIHAINEIPLSPGGKIDRKSLPQLGYQVSKSSVSARAPETQVEKMLHEIWSEVLQTSQLGIDDKFLNIGGNSLQAIRVMARVNENFGLDLTLTSIFEYPTIWSFGRFVEKTIDQLLDQG